MERMYHIEYYISKDGQHILFATLKENPMHVFFFDKKEDEWKYRGLSFEKIKQDIDVEKIKKEIAIINTMGKFVEEQFEDLGFKIENENLQIKDKVDELVDNLIDFAISHYKFGIKKEVLLNLTAKELDDAYHCGFMDLFNETYETFLLRKQNGQYSEINIIKKDDDFIVELDEKILNK